MPKTIKIVFLGNGSYLNRGCEAIVRGTVALMRKAFLVPLEVNNLIFAEKTVIEWQKKIEKDNTIKHYSLDLDIEKSRLRRYCYFYERQWAYDWFVPMITRVMPLFPAYGGLSSCIGKADAILEIGGDNYTFDYCYPSKYFCLDDQVRAQQRAPLFLWGASTGDFSNRNKKLQRIMLAQLNKFDLIFVRETESYDCLQAQKIEKICLMRDPAFEMVAEKPVRPMERIPSNCVGINLSPLLAKYYPGGLCAWRKAAGEIVAAVAGRIALPIVLIPHVTISFNGERLTQHELMCDHAFMADVLAALPKSIQKKVYLLPDNLNAAETKWIIGQVRVFLGARTHSAIAAFSSYAPTLSLAYSLKAKGLNRDIYGNLDYCCEVGNISPNRICELTERLLVHHADVSATIQNNIELSRSRSTDACNRLGEYLRFQN